jgi:hypothetical protein
MNDKEKFLRLSIGKLRINQSSIIHEEKKENDSTYLNQSSILQESNRYFNDYNIATKNLEEKPPYQYLRSKSALIYQEALGKYLTVSMLYTWLIIL